MNQFFKITLGTLLCLFCVVNTIQSQHVEKIVAPNIATAQLFVYGDQQGLPVIALNSNDRLELHFDDLDGGLKSYYYTYELCDYNWQPAGLSPFDYIKGFTQNRLNTYRYSSISFTNYTHYSAILPDKNAVLSRSGNYLLKVFLDGDTSKLMFTKQMMVLDPKSSIVTQVLQPFTPDKFKTHQKLRFTASLKDLNTFSAAQQVKTVILQNNRWDNAQRNIPPTFVRGTNLEYNSEALGIFPAGKEWRWLDLRSFRLQSDRVADGKYHKNSTDLFLKTDIDRRGERYVYFPDYNGMYQISSYESINPLWQGDYATVYFSLAAENGVPFPNRDIYLTGAFTNYALNDTWKMIFNEATGRYETTAFLKQGYYNYTYTSVDQNNPADKLELEGNYWETENSYTILLYYKAFNDRNDQLIGVSQVNSRTDKPGFSF